MTQGSNEKSPSPLIPSSFILPVQENKRLLKPVPENFYRCFPEIRVNLKRLLRVCFLNAFIHSGTQGKSMFRFDSRETFTTDSSKTGGPGSLYDL